MPLRDNRLWPCETMCVSLPPRLLITSGVIWTPYDWLNKFYSCYMVVVVVINNGCGLGIDLFIYLFVNQ